MNRTSFHEDSTDDRTVRPEKVADRSARWGHRGLMVTLSLAFAILWGGIAWRIDGALRESEDRTVREASNLARAFDENVRRTVGNIDQALLSIRQNFERTQGMAFNASAELGLAQSMNALALHLSIADDNGWVTHVSRDGAAGNANLGDQEYFQVHKDSVSDRLHISPPVADPVSERVAILFTRRLQTRDGGFGGVLALSVDPYLLSEFYKTVDLGPAGAVAVVGRDGYVRAGSRLDEGMIGVSLYGTSLFDHIAQSPAGQFVDPATANAGPRVVSYRAVMDYPLIVTVAIPARSWGAALREDFKRDVLVGIVLSILMGVAAWVLGAGQAEQARRDRRQQAVTERLNAVLESLPTSTAFVDRSGRLRFANRAWRALGYMPNDLGAGNGGDRFEKVGSGALAAQIQNALDEVLRDHSEGATLDFASATGQIESWYQLVFVPLIGAEGGAVLQLTDITAMRALAENAATIEDRLNFITDTMNEWSWELDKDFRFSWVSSAFVRATGRDPHNILGRSLEAIIDEAHSGALRSLREDFSAGRSIDRFEFSGRDANGSSQILILSAAPIQRSNGDVAGYRGIVRNITEARNFVIERQLFMARMTEADDRYRAMFDIPDSAVIVLDGDGILVACSAAFCALIGRASEAVVGGGFTDFGPPTMAAAVRENLVALWENPGAFAMTLTQSTGSPAEVVVSGRRVTISGMGYLFASVHDRSALKKTEAELAAIRERRAADLVAVQNLLKAVGRDVHNQGYSLIDLAHRARALEGSARPKGALDAIDKAVRRLMAVSADILDGAEAPDEKNVKVFERFDLERLVGEACALVEDLTSVKGIDVVIVIAPDVPRHLMGDARRLGRLVLNGLIQAATWTETGEIVLRIERARIRSEGFGIQFLIDISAEVQELSACLGSAFDRRDWDSAILPNVPKDCGIGTAFFASLVERLGGEWGGGNDVRGRSTLWFALPLESAKGKESAVLTGLSSHRMLIVDDNAAQRDALAVMLSDLGVTADRLATGKEALEAITSALATDRPYTVVFIDQGLRDVDSFETISRIRGQYGAGTFPTLVVMSDAHMPESAMPHLAKPILRYRLHDLLTHILGQAPDASRAHLAAPRAEVSDPSILRGTRVLLVDDSPTDQVVARDMLEAVGVNVDVADNGAAAVELVGDNDYEIVLMDVRMPILGGVEAARRIRSVDRFARLPIIALTTEDWREMPESFIQFGFNDVVIKPIDPDQLYEVIRKWVVGFEAGFSRLH